MTNSVVYVGGSKGGTGKSQVALGIVDFVHKQSSNKILIIETDVTNPDVGSRFQEYPDDRVSVMILSLNAVESDGWEDMATAFSKYPDHTIIINTPGRLLRG